MRNDHLFVLGNQSQTEFNCESFARIHTLSDLKSKDFSSAKQEPMPNRSRELQVRPFGSVILQYNENIKCHPDPKWKTNQRLRKPGRKFPTAKRSGDKENEWHRSARVITELKFTRKTESLIDSLVHVNLINRVRPSPRKVISHFMTRQNSPKAFIKKDSLNPRPLSL
jgi:hypothetical protein